MAFGGAGAKAVKEAIACGMIAVRELAGLESRSIEGDASTVMLAPTDGQLRMAKEGAGDIADEVAADEADMAVGREIANLGGK